MDQKIIQFLIFFPVILISIVIHEFAHCWTTDRLGDETPRVNGRLTLNPLAHLDLFGTIMIVVSSFAGIGFGWGKPSPMNPMNFHHPARGRMISAAAGPISNLLQALAWASLGLLAHTFIPAPYSILQLFQFDPRVPFILLICFAGVIINITLAAFNLLPVYPLDGHHILGYLLPPLQPIIDNPLWGLLFLFLVFNTSLMDKIMMPIIIPMLKACIYLIGWPT